MRMLDNFLWILVVCVIVGLLGILSKSVYGQELRQDLPVGVTFKDGTYFVKRSALKKFRRSQIRLYKELAKEYEIKYEIVK